MFLTIILSGDKNDRIFRNLMAAELTKIITKIITSGDSSEIVSFVVRNHENPRLKDYVPRILNYLLDNLKLTEADAVWSSAGIDPVGVTTSDLGVLAIRYLIYTERLSEAIELYIRLKVAGQTRKKHLMLIVKEMLLLGNFHGAAATYLTHIAGFYATDASDIEMFLDAPADVRASVLKYHMHMPNVISVDAALPYDVIPFCPPVAPDGTVLELIPLLSSEVAELVTFVEAVAAKKKDIAKFRGYNKTIKRPDYVVDAANVLYYGEGVITINSYKRLQLVMSSLASKGCVQIILHERYCKAPKHFSPTDKRYVIDLINHMETNPVVSLYRTPYGMNDDWFSIVSAIEHGARLLTNDKFRDHIYASSIGTDREHNLLSVWCKEHNICYTITKFNTVLNIEEPCSYSMRVQKSETAYYIPRNDGSWISVKVA